MTMTNLFHQSRVSGIDLVLGVRLPVVSRQVFWQTRQRSVTADEVGAADRGGMVIVAAVPRAMGS